MMKKYLILQLILTIFLTANAQSIKKLGLWTKGVSTGPSTIVKFIDNYMIINSGRSIRLLDNSNADNPVELDAYTFLPVLNIIIYNDLIFVFPLFQPNVSVFKISVSNKLEFIKRITIEDSYIQVAQTDDKFIFLSSNKLYIYKLTNDINLDLQSTVQVTNNEYSSLTAYNNRCIVSFGAKIFIYDISNSSSPLEVVEYETGIGTIRNMDLKDNDLYLSGYHIGLRIVDLADEKKPSIRSNYYLENTFHFSLKDNYAFVWDNTLQGVDILDLSDKSSPTELSQFTINADQYGYVYNYQNKLYVCNRGTSNGLQVWNINNIESPVFSFYITSEYNRYTFKEVIVYKNSAILNCGPKGVIFANKSNYSQLEIMAEITGIPNLNTITTYSNFLLLDCGTEMLIYDIQNPSAPSLLSTITFPQEIKSLTINDGKIFVAIDKKFFIYSIDDPINPLLEFESLNITPSNLHYEEIDKINNTIHISIYHDITDTYPYNERKYIDIYDISNPTEANLLIRINSDNYPLHLYQYQGVCYGIDENKIEVYNFDDPTNYNIINTITLSKPILSMKFFDNMGYGVYIGNSYNGWESLLLIDVSKPNNPTELGVEDFDTGIFSFDKDNQIFYMCWNTNGVSIYEVDAIDNIEEKSIDKDIILANYPNPFNPTTKIKFSISNSSKVELRVFDVLGRRVKTLINEQKLAGQYTIQFDGSNLTNGVYFYRLQVGNFVKTNKMILIK